LKVLGENCMRTLLSVLSLLLCMSLFVHAKPLEKVSLQLQWLDQFQFAGYYMAIEKGFYEQKGLELELLEYNNSINTADRVLNKKATYGIGRTNLIIERSKGKELVLLAAAFQSSPSVLVTTKESGIQNVKDFRGKNIMTVNNVLETASIQAMINHHGMSIEDMNPIPHSADIKDLITKKTDLMTGYLSNEPFRLKEMGVEYRVFDPKDSGFDFYSDILFTSEEEVKSHRQRTIDFTKASIQGWEYAFSHIEETVDLIMKKYNGQNKSRESLLYEGQVLKELAYYKTQNLGEINKHKIQRIYDIYSVMGYVHEPVDIDALVMDYDNSFASLLTPQEKEWIQEHPRVRYSEVNWKPLSIIDNGKMTGIMGEYMEIVSKHTGLQFEYVPSDSWPHVLQQFKEKKIDIVPGIGSSLQEKELGLISDRYAHYPMVIITGKKYRFIESINELKDKVIAVPKQYTSYNFLVSEFPQIKLITTANIPEALSLVAEGEADAFVGHIATSLYYIGELNYTELKVSGMSKFVFEHHYLMQRTDPLLLSIINKALSQISDQERNQIYANWVHTTIEQDVNYSLVWEVALALLLILGILAYRQRTLEVYNKKLEAQKDLYDLVFETSFNGVLLLDFNTGTFLDCNQAMVKMLRLEYKEEVLDKHPSEFSPEFQPDGRRSAEKANEMINMAVEKGSYSFEWKHLRSDGEEFWAEIILTKITYNGKDLLHVTWKDIDDRKHAEQALLQQKNDFDYQAHHDVLTNLPNRILFNDRLEQAMLKSERSKKSVALFFMDLDRFKQINDSLGHEVGDDVLKIVAERITSVIRKEDTLARLGGDEFTIIMENVSAEDDAAYLAQKILNILALPIEIDGHTFYLSGSIGISLYPQDGLESHNLLKYADAAMYKAKEENGNNYQFYSAKMTEQVFEHVVMEANLRKALEHEEFVVFYQPQINGRDDSLIGMEALVRWIHPKEGMVSPAKFIPLAEETGLIVDLDLWVMKTGMKQMASWYAAGLNPGVLALNLSIKQLQNKAFFSILQESLQETGCKPEWLEFEVTESQIMKNPEATVLLLNKFSTMGIELAVDDFGTGYSSLSYLKRLPIDKLKIDQAFIQDLPDDDEDVGISKAIIALAKSLNLKVIAEGVETKEQKAFLLEHGCENIQGYFYSKPIPALEMYAKFLKL
jgi:diguanylate cyclase (GGDEF)-like protein/PAS domain S-box-containing protein